MRNSTHALRATALAATLLVAALNAVSTPPASGTTSRAQSNSAVLFPLEILKGETAVAGFRSADPTGCVTTETVVIANAQALNPAGPGRQADQTGIVDVKIFNHCLDVMLFNGVAVSDSFHLAVASNLSLAKVQADMTLANFVDGSSIPLRVDLTFTATSPRTSVRNHQLEEFGNTRFITGLKGDQRPATATGQVVTSDGINHTPLASVAGSIQTLALKTIAIGK